MAEDTTSTGTGIFSSVFKPERPRWNSNGLSFRPPALTRPPKLDIDKNDIDASTAGSTGTTTGGNNSIPYYDTPPTLESDEFRENLPKYNSDTASSPVYIYPGMDMGDYDAGSDKRKKFGFTERTELKTIIAQNVATNIEFPNRYLLNMDERERFCILRYNNKIVKRLKYRVHNQHETVYPLPPYTSDMYKYRQYINGFFKEKDNPNGNLAYNLNNAQYHRNDDSHHRLNPFALRFDDIIKNIPALAGTQVPLNTSGTPYNETKFYIAGPYSSVFPPQSNLHYVNYGVAASAGEIANHVLGASTADPAIVGTAPIFSSFVEQKKRAFRMKSSPFGTVVETTVNIANSNIIEQRNNTNKYVRTAERINPSELSRVKNTVQKEYWAYHPSDKFDVRDSSRGLSDTTRPYIITLETAPTPNGGHTRNYWMWNINSVGYLYRLDPEQSRNYDKGLATVARVRADNSLIIINVESLFTGALMMNNLNDKGKVSSMFRIDGSNNEICINLRNYTYLHAIPSEEHRARWVAALVHLTGRFNTVHIWGYDNYGSGYMGDLRKAWLKYFDQPEDIIFGNASCLVLDSAGSGTQVALYDKNVANIRSELTNLLPARHVFEYPYANSVPNGATWDNVEKVFRLDGGVISHEGTYNEPARVDLNNTSRLFKHVAETVKSIKANNSVVNNTLPVLGFSNHNDVPDSLGKVVTLKTTAEYELDRNESIIREWRGGFIRRTRHYTYKTLVENLPIDSMNQPSDNNALVANIVRNTSTINIELVHRLRYSGKITQDAGKVNLSSMFILRGDNNTVNVYIKDPRTFVHGLSWQDNDFIYSFLTVHGTGNTIHVWGLNNYMNAFDDMSVLNKINHIEFADRYVPENRARTTCFLFSKHGNRLVIHNDNYVLS